MFVSLLSLARAEAGRGQKFFGFQQPGSFGIHAAATFSSNPGTAAVALARATAVPAAAFTHVKVTWIILICVCNCMRDVSRLANLLLYLLYYARRNPPLGHNVTFYRSLERWQGGCPDRQDHVLGFDTPGPFAIG